MIGRIGIDVITKELPVRASQFDKENRPILGPAASGNKAPERIPLSDLVVRDALAAGELLVSLPLAGQNMRRPAEGHDSLRFFEQRLDKGVKFAAFDYLGAGIVCGEHVESAEPIGHRALNHVNAPGGIVAELRLGQPLFLRDEQPREQ